MCLLFTGLTAQATILAYLFNILERGVVTVQLSQNYPAEQNVLYIQNYLLDLLKTAFPNLLEYAPLCSILHSLMLAMISHHDPITYPVYFL